MAIIILILIYTIFSTLSVAAGLYLLKNAEPTDFNLEDYKKFFCIKEQNNLQKCNVQCNKCKSL